MSDIVEFLRARLDEEERAARALNEWPYIGTTVDGRRLSNLTVAYEDEDGLSSKAPYDPARVLREVEAKRAIVAQLEDMLGGDPCQEGAEAAEMLPVIAAVYSDHPDYREEWRP